MKTFALSAIALCLLSACGDGGSAPAAGTSAKPATSGSAQAATSAAASAAPTATAAATADASASAAAAPGETSAAPVAGDAPTAPVAGSASGMPADVQKLVDAVGAGDELKDPKLDGFFFMGAKGSKLDSPPVPGSWSEITSDGASMAFFAHSPSDGGDGCPTMADMKKLVKDAKTIVDVSAKNKPSGKESFGNEIELWVFEKDGKTGFYGRKVFDKQDDDVTYCCAPGKPGEAEKMTTLLDTAKANALAGTCMALKQKL